MRIVLLCLAFLLIPASLLAEEEPPAEKAFPETWAGVWKGTAVSIKDGETRLRFAMELHVKPKEGGEGWSWQIIYGEGERRQVRPYELLPIDVDKGHWLIDEKNSIELDAYFENDRLHNRFWVTDNVIEATYARDGDTLEVTLTTFGEKPARISGGKGRVPPVTSYALRSVQRATLTRESK